MKPNLLMVCPTRLRVDETRRMLDSFYKTKSEGTEIILALSDDDPKLQEYLSNFKKENIFIHNVRYSNPKVNKVVALNPDIKYYGDVNDDHIFRTNEWDKKLIEAIETNGGGWGLACGDDLFSNNWFEYQHPSGQVMSGNVVKVLGYYCYPDFRDYATDMYYKELFTRINRLFFCSDVIIEHMHAHNDKARMDENYEAGYSEESKLYGIRVLNNWRDSCMKEDVRKLKEAIG